jgi:hypothetical protein
MFQKAWNVIKGHYFVSSCIIFVVICGIIALVAVLALKQDAGESGEGEEVVAVQDRDRDLSLKTNAYDFINSAMTDYYTALANNDQDKIKEYIVHPYVVTKKDIRKKKFQNFFNKIKKAIGL